MTKHVLTVVQARRGSSRLPDKVLRLLGDKTVLEVIIERINKARFCGDVVVATTTGNSDDVIENLCRQRKIHCFRGHETDLLDRHYSAALKFDADVVVKIPSDCPLIDHHIIDEVIGYYLAHNNQFDFVSNLHPCSWPDGNDVEVISKEVIETAWREAHKDFEREHTTPFIWENRDSFRIGNVVRNDGRDFSMSHRWTLDYEEDYIFIHTIYERLAQTNPDFTCEDILKLVADEPELLKINDKFNGVNWYRHHLEELKTVNIFQTRTPANEI